MNPWRGIDTWREFLWDARHPIWAIKGWIANVNHVTPTERRLCAGVMIIGLLNVLVALVTLAR